MCAWNFTQTDKVDNIKSSLREVKDDEIRCSIQNKTRQNYINIKNEWDEILKIRKNETLGNNYSKVDRSLRIVGNDYSGESANFNNGNNVNNANKAGDKLVLRNLEFNELNEFNQNSISNKMCEFSENSSEKSGNFDNFNNFNGNLNCNNCENVGNLNIDPNPNFNANLDKRDSEINSSNSIAEYNNNNSNSSQRNETNKTNKFTKFTHKFSSQRISSQTNDISRINNTSLNIYSQKSKNKIMKKKKKTSVNKIKTTFTNNSNDNSFIFNNFENNTLNISNNSSSSDSKKSSLLKVLSQRHPNNITQTNPNTNILEVEEEHLFEEDEDSIRTKRNFTKNNMNNSNLNSNDYTRRLINLKIDDNYIPDYLQKYTITVTNIKKPSFYNSVCNIIIHGDISNNKLSHIMYVSNYYLENEFKINNQYIVLLKIMDDSSSVRIYICFRILEEL